MTDAHDAPGSPSDEALRREATRSREARAGCPDPDLLLARESELLDPPVREALALHLRTCGACTRFAADVASLGLGEPDRLDEDRVFARLGHGPSRTSPWRIPLAAIVLLSCGAAAAWWMRSPARPAPVAAPDVTATAPAAPAPAPIVALWTIEPLAVRVPISSLGVPRSGAPVRDAASALAGALAPYQSGRYAEAVPALQSVVREHPESADAALYLGVSCLLANRPGEALGSLRSARSLADAGRIADVEWYLATAEQRTGQTDAARARLRALCQGSSDHRERACSAEQRLQ